MAATPNHIHVKLKSAELDKITAIYHDALNAMADERADLVTLTSWMAEDGRYTPTDIAEAVRKPHDYDLELRRAKAALEAEATQ